VTTGSIVGVSVAVTVSSSVSVGLAVGSAVDVGGSVGISVDATAAVGVTVGVPAVNESHVLCNVDGPFDTRSTGTGDAFLPAYDDLLSSTGEGMTAELAARFGIDVRDRGCGRTVCRSSRVGSSGIWCCRGGRGSGEPMGAVSGEVGGGDRLRQAGDRLE
jgi:hypothetical protein